ncbi:MULTISPECIES: hypothetical protein [Mesorhizobium]|uniref:hypothetical protein n=1 Tax=Mesorhizobium TaxID=68287 RepID=UPI001459FC06|nr:MULTISPECIES: hypothetical protein [Mesorhizobium]
MSDAFAVLRSTRLPAGPEKDVQAAIADAFANCGIAFEREVNLGDGDIIDFVVGDLGIEVKIKGSPRAILRQLRRYAAHSQLSAIALVSSVAMGVPPAIGAKRLDIVSLGRAWL